MTSLRKRDVDSRTLASGVETGRPGWKKAAFDAGLIFAVLLAAELLRPGSLDAAQTWPHPFWLPVIYLTVQYGSHAGVAAAAIATALLLSVVQPERSSIHDLYEHNLSLLLEPALWLASALTLGQITDRRHRDRNVLEERVAFLIAQRNRVAEHACELQERVAEIERVLVAGTERSIETAMVASVRLRKASVSEGEICLKEAAAAFFGPCVLSLHLLEEEHGQFSPSRGIACGGADLVDRSTSYACAPILIDSMRAGREIVSILGDDDAAVRAGVLFAAPLMERESLRAVLCLRSVDPDALKPWAERAFSLLAEDLAQSLFFSLKPRLSNGPIVPNGVRAA